MAWAGFPPIPVQAGVSLEVRLRITDIRFKIGGSRLRGSLLKSAFRTLTFHHEAYYRYYPAQ